MQNQLQQMQIIEERHQSHKREAFITAKALATQERPSTPEEVSICANEIRVKYQGLIEMVNAGLQPKTHLAMGEVENKVAKQETNELDQAIAGLRHRLNVHRMDHPERHGAITVPLKAMMVVVITLILFTAQGLWESGAFLATGETRMRATLIAIGITIAFALFAHACVWLIRKLQRHAWKLLVGAGTMAIAFIGYFVIGSFRARFLAEYLGYSEDLDLSPWMFALLSMVVFTAVAAISFMFLPSLEEVEEYHARRKAKRELWRKMNEVRVLEMERKAMPRRLAERMEELSGKVESAHALKLRIRELHRETHFAFIQANTMRRMTPPPPAMFNNPVELDLYERQLPTA